MHLLVTAGNTLVPIDKVRCLTNRFTGKTGAAIALEAHARGHSVRLLTSHPAVLAQLQPHAFAPDQHWQLTVYQTFDELHALMREHLQQGLVDGLIHSAAVSDYTYAGIYAPSPRTTFDPRSATWQTSHLSP